MTVAGANLSDVCAISMGQAPKGTSYNTEGIGYPLLAGAGDFGDATPEPSKYTDAPTKLSNPGDVVLCIRATIGDRNWSDGAYCLGRGVAGLRGDQGKLDQHYLWHWLGHVAPVLRSKGRGATFLQVSKADIASLQIPLPPLTEQKRIAAILDAADALRAKRRESIEQLDTLVQSVFLDMFGDPVTNPKGWEVLTLAEVADFHAGSTLPDGEEFCGQPGGFLHLKVSELNDPSNTPLIVRSKSWSLDRRRGIVAPPDSVVIPKRGGAIGTNKKRLLTRPAVLDPNLMGISASKRLSHLYLYRWFYTFDLVSITSGSTVPQLNKRDLGPLKIQVPPLDIQHRFAGAVEAIERQRTCLEAHLAELDTLFASLQSRAFQGEL